jgi:PKD repeat protein
MDKPRLSIITRAVTLFFAVLLITGCNFWGLDSLKILITSPSADTTISIGQSVNFQSEVQFGSSPYTYQWDFGGGATNSTVQNPGATTFSTAGTYTVNVTVTDSNGDTAQDSVVITVQSSSGLTVSITSSNGNNTISPGDSVNFQSTVSGGTGSYSYLWNFDGGTGSGGATTSTEQNPSSIIFGSAGTYTVALTVSDNSGSTAHDSITVIVQ